MISTFFYSANKTQVVLWSVFVRSAEFKELAGIPIILKYRVCHTK